MRRILREFRDNRRHRRRWTVLLVLAALLAAGCNDSRDPTDPGPPPLPVPAAPRDLATVPLPTAEHPPRWDRIDWSDDDAWLLYAAGPGSDVWRIAADGTGRPEPVTQAATGGWLEANYSPCALAGERVAFFHGWYDGDRRLHLLASPVTGTGGEAVTVLHAFPPTAVGLAPDQVSSPQALTLSADGCRLVGFWHDAYLLTWPDSTSLLPPTVHLLEGPTPTGGLALTRDGERLAFVDEGGWLVVAPVTDLATSRRVGHGTLPAWDGAGTRLAYLAPDGAVMTWDGGDTVVPYTIRLAGPVVELALSWDGEHIALLVRDEQGYALHTGDLADSRTEPGSAACP